MKTMLKPLKSPKLFELFVLIKRTFNKGLEAKRGAFATFTATVLLAAPVASNPAPLEMKAYAASTLIPSMRLGDAANPRSSQVLSSALSPISQTNTNPVNSNAAGSTAVPAPQPSSGANRFIYRAKAGDTAEKIAFDFLADAATKSVRDGFYALNRINSRDALKELPLNQPVSIPVAAMFTKPVAAMLVNASGDSQMRHTNTQQRFQDVSSFRAVEEGATLRTGDKSFITVRFPDNSVMMMSPNSEVLIESLRQYASTDVFKIKLLLNKGRAESSVKPLSSEGSEYSIRSRRLTTGVRGTHFSVSDEEGSNATAQVYEGGVSLADASGATSLLSQGYGSFAARNTASAPVSLIHSPAWACDLKANSFEQALALAFIKQPVLYRVDIFSAQLGQQQLIMKTPRLPADLPYGSYHVSVRGIDENGLHGFATERVVTVKSNPNRDILRWIPTQDRATFTLANTESQSDKAFACEPS